MGLPSINELPRNFGLTRGVIALWEKVVQLLSIAIMEFLLIPLSLAAYGAVQFMLLRWVRS